MQTLIKQNSLVLIKPNLVLKHKDIDVLIDLVNELSKHKCKIVKMKKFTMTVDLVTKFYQEHATKSFFKEIVNMMTSGDIIAISISGENAIKVVRDILGNTDPSKADKNTLRAKYGESIGENGTHGSDSTTSSEREHNLIFNDK